MTVPNPYFFNCVLPSDFTKNPNRNISFEVDVSNLRMLPCVGKVWYLLDVTSCLLMHAYQTVSWITIILNSVLSVKDVTIFKVLHVVANDTFSVGHWSWKEEYVFDNSGLWIYSFKNICRELRFCIVVLAKVVNDILGTWTISVSGLPKAWIRCIFRFSFPHIYSNVPSFIKIWIIIHLFPSVFLVLNIFL